MPEETEVVAAKETPAPPAETVEKPEPKSPRERLEAIYDEHSKADAEEAAAEAPAAEGTPSADPAGSEAKPAEITPAAPEKVVVTDEQLADTAYWGGLDAEGWKRMERDYPVQTKLVKSAQAAASKIVNGARKTAPPPPEERHEAPTDDEPSDALIDAVRMSQSLDEKEAAKGHLLIAKLTASAVLKEGGIDPARNKAQAVLGEAVNAAIAELPDIGNFKLTELDAVAEESPALKKLAESGDPESVKIALVEAGRILIGRKKAAADAAKAAADKAEADRKKKETQKIVQSSAHLASADVLKPHGGSPDTRTQRERLNAAADREIARQNAIGAK